MSAKIHLCTKVEYIQTKYVQSLSDSAITILDGYSINSFSARIASFSESLSVAVNDYISQILTISAIGESRNNDYAGKTFIFRLTFSDGSQIIWGDLDLPVRIDKLQTNTNSNSFTFKRIGKMYLFG
jgi:hypothetical protein